MQTTFCLENAYHVDSALDTALIGQIISELRAAESFYYCRTTITGLIAAEVGIKDGSIPL